ncbi:ABC transporter ATP-binding protein [Ruegeria sediminis]|uniref:ABC transporter ATP-binding protein n=1 Tax=Ruegeria sediminis TaxID=2583820 RepID=A0ABY2WU73_9RHOB|nr:ABC transporter ATP-binding protein [Ruegeria sediminis]TMV05569.1 ABC transporter ATP-binding protein [Ruegeria sediminis]
MNAPLDISARSLTATRLQMAGVCYGKGGVDILTDVTLDLTERRIGIVGRNGSGKSTLVRLLCGLIAPDSGEVRVGGIDCFADRRAALRTVGILFQNPDHQIIFPTVGEEVAFGLRQMGHAKTEARKMAHAALEGFGRTDWYDRPVQTLSQGQRHLVCLISVLAMQPKVIVLDEPFSGLDIPTTRALRRVLDDIDATLVHVTHDPGSLAGYDHVIWLSEGRIADQGRAEPVLAHFLDQMDREGDRDAFADLSG